MGRTILRGAAMMLLAAMLLGVAAVAPAAARWRPVRIPAHEIQNNYAVSCASASSCYVAGADGNPGFMHFDGHRLSARPSPQFDPPYDSVVRSLVCTSRRFCMAVGTRQGSPAAAARWNGKRWSLLSVPVHVPARVKHANRASTTLISVACASSSMCLAVGVWHVPSSGIGVEGYIAVRWNGRRWTAIKVPIRHASLLSVACASTVDCTVIGVDLPPHARTFGRPVSLRWRDGHWSPLAFAVAPGVTRIQPASISCPVAGRCVAVGTALRAAVIAGKRRQPYRALVLRQHGDTWVARTLPVAHSISRLAKGPSGQQLAAVSCPRGSAGGCVAVGTWGAGRDGGNPLDHGLAAALLPGRALIRPLHDPGPSSISCPTIEFCLAAGESSIERLGRPGFSGSFFGG